MKPPVTYFEWKEMLDKFADGDDSVVPLLNDGVLTLDAGTVSRFSALIEQTYKKRKQLWYEKFKSITQNQIVRSTSDFSVYITQAKMALNALIRFAELKPFPDDIKTVLRSDLLSFVQEIKKSLKENAFRDRNSHMNSLLLAFENLDVNKASTANNNPIAPDASPNRRKIIF